MKSKWRDSETTSQEESLATQQPYDDAVKGERNSGVRGKVDDHGRVGKKKRIVSKERQH
jgi:hypothetical protein